MAQWGLEVCSQICLSRNKGVREKGGEYHLRDNLTK